RIARLVAQVSFSLIGGKIIRNWSTHFEIKKWSVTVVIKVGNVSVSVGRKRMTEFVRRGHRAGGNVDRYHTGELVIKSVRDRATIVRSWNSSPRIVVGRREGRRSLIRRLGHEEYDIGIHSE